MNANKFSERVTQWVLSVQHGKEAFWILHSQIWTMKTFETLLNLCFYKMGIIITVLRHWVVQWIISNVFLPNIMHVINNTSCLLFQKLFGKQWFTVIPWWYYNCSFKNFTEQWGKQYKLLEYKRDGHWPWIYRLMSFINFQKFLLIIS